MIKDSRRILKMAFLESLFIINAVVAILAKGFVLLSEGYPTGSTVYSLVIFLDGSFFSRPLYLDYLSSNLSD